MHGFVLAVGLPPLQCGALFPIELKATLYPSLELAKNIKSYIMKPLVQELRGLLLILERLATAALSKICIGFSFYYLGVL
jgi:hypothetical protein